jgi:arylsulfatase
VKDHRLHYVQNYVGLEELHVESRPQLYVDRRLEGEEAFPVTIPLQIGITEGLTVARDDLSGVSRMYRPPFEFTGGLHEVVVEVEGPLIDDDEAEARNLMARQ